MGSQDREHWDKRYRDHGIDDVVAACPANFVNHREVLLAAESVLEVACGAGRAAVWLALNGANVVACDVSPIAIDHARRLALANGVADQCVFTVVDLDDGLPPGSDVDLVLCSLFRDATLDVALVDRLKPGGTLAIACLSEVGAAPGRFRAAPGELATSFAALELVAHNEADGVAVLVGRKRTCPTSARNSICPR